MATDLAKRSTELQKFTPEELNLIKQTVAKDSTDQELSLFLYTAGLRGLNPLTRQIHFVKRGGQGTIQTGIDGFRLIAQRTGKYAPGSQPTVFEYDSKGNLLRATVYGMKIMNGQAFEFSATAKYSEYRVDSNQIWRKMPETMLEKCAEAKMLRRGFPEELSGLYTDEEMAQADGEIKVHQAGSPTQIINQNEQGGESEVEGVDSDNPYAHYLDICPEHGDSWRVNKFGKRYHPMLDNEFCNFSNQIKVILEDRGKEAGFKTNTDFNDWCKENYDGRTWSKLSEKEQIEALWKIDQLGENKGTNLLVEVAKEEYGAVEE
jgi:phage recombination protein Bet